jgi:hypothetical protein
MKIVKIKWRYYDWIDAYNIENVGKLIGSGEHNMFCNTQLEIENAETHFLQIIERFPSLQPFHHDQLIWSVIYPDGKLTPKN